MKTSIKDELLRLAAILKRDTTPPFKKFQQSPTSEVDQQLSNALKDNDNASKPSNGYTASIHSTSESENSTNKSTDKTEITSNYVLPSTTTSIYSPQKSIPSTTTTKSSATSLSSKKSKTPSTYDIEIVDCTKFNNFLKAYVKQHKLQKQLSKSSTTTTTIKKGKKVKTKTPFSSPSISSFRSTTNLRKLRRLPTAHPMKLRRLTTTPKYTPFRQLAAQNLSTTFQNLPFCAINHIYNENGVKLNIDKLLHLDPDIWKPSVSNELGRLAKGIRNVRGNEAIEFVPKTSIPTHKKVTYANMINDYRPYKDDPYRTRLTIGGDKLDYYGNSSSPAASLLESKLIINSVISDTHKGARFMSIDIKDYFLQSFLPEPEYMKIHGKYFFEDIRKQYDIDKIIDEDGFVYCKIVKGMYGLKQAAMLGRENIITVLKPFGYYPDPMSPNIWQHTTRPTKFCLCVDDFGVKYFSQKDLDHLIIALQTTFKISIDMKGDKYCGLHLKWNYDLGYVDVSMPEFVLNTLDKLHHPSPKKPQHSPNNNNL